MFDSEFKLIKSIGDNLKGVYYLSIDSKTLFISEFEYDVLSIKNIDNDKVIKKIKVDSIIQQLISTAFMLLVLLIVNMRRIKENKFKWKEEINVISKKNLDITNKIQFNKWLLLRSIHSSNDQICSIASKLDDNAVRSENRFLIQINKQNKTIKTK